MKKGVLTREAILLIIAVLTLITFLIVIMFLTGRGEDIVSSIARIFTFQF
jgi:hypothetical protein